MSDDYRMGEDEGSEFGFGGPRGRRSSRFGKFGPRARRIEPEHPLDYKNHEYLSQFVGPTGKIQARRRSGFSGQHQRRLAQAIKHARFMALMPFVGSANTEAPERDRERRRRD